MTHTFSGFPKPLTKFLSDLENNNEKQWFEAHRVDYEALFTTPALAFIKAMVTPITALDPNIRAEAKLNGSLRRIYRDTRFSKDKTPYNPRLHMIFWEGDKPMRAPGFHVVLGANYLGIGAGAWGLEGESLNRFREAMTNPKCADGLHEAIRIGENDGGYQLDAPTLKRVPSGFDANSPYEDLLRQKALILRNEVPLPDDIFGPEALSYTIERFRPMLPLHHWIMKHIFFTDMK